MEIDDLYNAIAHGQPNCASSINSSHLPFISLLYTFFLWVLRGQSDILELIFMHVAQAFHGFDYFPLF